MDTEIQFSVYGKEEIILPTPHAVRELICYLDFLDSTELSEASVFLQLYSSIVHKSVLNMQLLKAIDAEPKRQEVIGITLSETQTSSFLKFTDIRSPSTPTWKRLSGSMIEVTNDKASRYCLHKFTREHTNGLPLTRFIVNDAGEVVKQKTFVDDTVSVSDSMLNSISEIKARGLRILLAVSSEEFEASNPCKMWEDHKARRY